MASIAKIPVTNNDPVAALQAFLASLLQRGVADAVFTMRQRPDSGVSMPALITDPALLAQANPLSPAFPLNGAKLLSRLTHGESSGVVAAVLRPCELRAFVELIKLNQGNSDNLLLIGLDCYGAYDNHTYRQALQGTDARTLTNAFVSGCGNIAGGQEIAKACKACEYATPEGADLALGLFGADLDQYIPLISQSAAGENAVRKLELEDAGGSGRRNQTWEELSAQRIAFRDAMFEETAAATASMDKLGEYLSGCVNCYNCRVACPVCYCKECVFLTDVFDHKPWQYMGWAEKSGMLRMPTDTAFFHLTRLAHMSTACVGCGQCSNACPNDIPVMELFRTVAARTQKAFEYVPGRDPNEAPPLAVFKEKEFGELTEACA